MATYGSTGLLIGGAPRSALGMPSYGEPAAATMGPRERRMQSLFRGLTALGAGLIAGGAPRIGAPAGASAYAPGLLAFQEALQSGRAEAVADEELQLKRDAEARQAMVAEAQIANLESQVAKRDAERAFQSTVIDRYAGPNAPLDATPTAEPQPLPAPAVTYSPVAGRPETTVTATPLGPPEPSPEAPPALPPVTTPRKSLSPDQRTILARLAASGPDGAREALKREAEWTAPTEIKPSDVKGMRDQYRADSSTFKEMTGSYNRIRGALRSPTGPSDIGLLFNYMKMIDPGSVVREGEQYLLRRATSLPGWVLNYFEQAKTGRSFTEKQRAQIVEAADRYYQSEADRHETRREDYKQLASQTGIRPNLVVFDTYKRAPPLSPSTYRMAEMADPSGAVNHPMASRAIPQAAIDRLRANPRLAEDFNAMFARENTNLAELFLR